VYYFCCAFWWGAPFFFNLFASAWWLSLGKILFSPFCRWRSSHRLFERQQRRFVRSLSCWVVGLPTFSSPLVWLALRLFLALWRALGWGAPWRCQGGLVLRRNFLASEVPCGFRHQVSHSEGLVLCGVAGVEPHLLSMPHCPSVG
jgi:hypothetical protein